MSTKENQEKPSRKLFLSFLGISNYEPVSYYLDSERRSDMASLEKYVQKPLLDALADHFSPTDKAVIFLTDEAKQINWLDNGHINRKTEEAIPNKGLLRLMQESNYTFDFEAVMVDGESENEAIWRTFQLVFEQINPGDEVYFDITHSWRYLPMLGMTLLHYAKVLRSIEVKAIYYGAFERLGNFSEVQKLAKDARPVPILNLVSFSDLQDWTVAADDFVRNGNPDRLSQLTRTNIDPVLKESKGQDQIARNLNEITRRLGHLTTYLATNRGQRIWQFDFLGLERVLQDFSAENSYIKPLNGVVEHIRSKVNGFYTGGINLQWLEGVNWCIKHKLTQQGLTQLQEGLLSWLCTHYEQRAWADPGYFEFTRRNGRNLLSVCLQFIEWTPPEDQWKGEAEKQTELVHKIMEDPLAISLSKEYGKLSKARNDINHGGYTSDNKPEKFLSLLQNCYEEIRRIVMDYNPAEAEKEVGLLNISNHPFEHWPDIQRKVAVEHYGEVLDLPFPNVDPQMDQTGLQKLVNNYFEEANRLQPKAVHLMGEMTFTFALVSKLKAAGIPCIASTTERIIEVRDSKKVVHFQFVQFRPY